MPANYKIPPHYHKASENVTVLAGVFHIGLGEEFDQGSGQELPTTSRSSTRRTILARSRGPAIAGATAPPGSPERRGVGVISFTSWPATATRCRYPRS